MSRIGNKPITVPAGVEVKIDGNHISVKGPKGTLERDVEPEISMKLEENVLSVSRSSEDRTFYKFKFYSLLKYLIWILYKISKKNILYKIYVN